MPRRRPVESLDSHRAAQLSTAPGLSEVSGRREALRRMINERSVLRGEFVLTSGRKSNYYIDGRMTTLSADGAALTGKYIFEMIRDLSIDAVGGPTVGADPMATAISLAGYHAGQSIDAFIVRSDRKRHGTMKQIEGPIRSGGRVVIVDDTVTTGNSLLDAAEAAKEAGCEVVKIVAILDRLQGGSQKIRERGYDFEAILTNDDLDLPQEPT